MSKIIQFPHQRTKKNDQQILKGFIKCDKCGNVKFQQVFVLKVITPLDDPNLIQNSVMPLPVFQCSNCKKVITTHG